ncbi:MAG: cytochrome P450, partial [Pyrinomonadaceae bacterium]
MIDGATTTSECDLPIADSWLPGLSQVRAYRDPLGFLTRTAEAYPDIAHMRLGKRRDVLVFHPEHVRDVLLASERQMRRGFNPILRRIMGNGLLSSQGEFHRSQRRLIQPVLSRRRLEIFSETMVRNTLLTSDEWKPGTTLDIAEAMMQLSFEIIVDIIFGTRPDDAQNLREVVNQAIGMTGRKGYMRKFLADKLNLFASGGPESYICRLDEIVYASIDKQRNGNEKVNSLIFMLLDVLCSDESNTAENIRQVRNEAVTLLFAGHETIANALAWTWYMLSQNPTEENRLHEELEQVLDQRTPSFEDMPRLTYTTAILREAMRLYPPVWLIVRRPIQDWQLGRYRIPAGSYLYVSPYLVHRDRRFFDNPDEFTPSRWVSGTCDSSRHRFSYIPFGVAGWKCIGDSFAMTEGVIILATIAQKWRM